MVRGEINEKTAYIQARSFKARKWENNGKKRKAEGKAKVVGITHEQECAYISRSCYALSKFEEKLWEWCIL